MKTDSNFFRKSTLNEFTNQINIINEAENEEDEKEDQESNSNSIEIDNLCKDFTQNNQNNTLNNDRTIESNTTNTSSSINTTQENLSKIIPTSGESPSKRFKHEIN